MPWIVTVFLMGLLVVSNAKIWDNLISDITHQIAESHTYEQTIICISSLSNVIEAHQPLTLVQIEDLNKFYESALIMTCGKHQITSQSLLAQLIQAIVGQNRIIGINLSVAVWNEFFRTYYKLHQD